MCPIFGQIGVCSSNIGNCFFFLFLQKRPEKRSAFSEPFLLFSLLIFSYPFFSDSFLLLLSLYYYYFIAFNL